MLENSLHTESISKNNYKILNARRKFLVERMCLSKKTMEYRGLHLTGSNQEIDQNNYVKLYISNINYLFQRMPKSISKNTLQEMQEIVSKFIWSWKLNLNFYNIQRTDMVLLSYILNFITKHVACHEWIKFPNSRRSILEGNVLGNGNHKYLCMYIFCMYKDTKVP